MMGVAMEVRLHHSISWKVWMEYLHDWKKQSGKMKKIFSLDVPVN